LPEESISEGLLTSARLYLILSYTYRGDKEKAYRLAEQMIGATSAEIVIDDDMDPIDVMILRDIFARVRKK
jgi:hypothetical protein